MRRLIGFISILVVLCTAGGIGYWYATVPQPARMDVQIAYLRDFLIYQYTQAKTTDLQEAEIDALAKKGNLHANLVMGEILFRHGVADNAAYDRAMPYLRTSAEMGIPKAQNALGAAYQHGFGTERDIVASYQWYKLATDQHDQLARRNLFDVSTDLNTTQVDAAITRADNWLGKYRARKLELNLLPQRVVNAMQAGTI